jgi:hypothetical protein
MVDTKNFNTQQAASSKWRDGEGYCDNDYDSYCDNDDRFFDQYDYDDFSIHASRGGGGTMDTISKREKEKQKGKNTKGNPQNVYSSKHVRAKESLRAGRKARKTKAKVQRPRIV